MFTGIVQAQGRIARIERLHDCARLAILARDLVLDDVSLGDSIAVSGPCLTVVACSATEFAVDVSTETLQRTTLGAKRVGDAVNLEKSLRLSDRLGGHLVSGHVDGVGEIADRTDLTDYIRLRVKAPPALEKYIAEKGSICVDGVSLTVNSINTGNFELMIIPHTLQETTLGDLVCGDHVNLEIDLIARYLERLAGYVGNEITSTLSGDTLQRAGFVRE